MLCVLEHVDHELHDRHLRLQLRDVAGSAQEEELVDLVAVAVAVTAAAAARHEAPQHLHLLPHLHVASPAAGLHPRLAFRGIDVLAHRRLRRR